MATYYTLLTNIGQAKIANAIALGQTVAWTHMAVGDGNGNPTTPNETQTALVRERYRALINQLSIDPENPNYMVAELVVPTNVGGWSVNEVGIFDEDNDLVAVANFPATYKPQLEEGSGRDLVIRIIVQVSNASVVELKIDPAIVLASQKWVVDQFVRKTTVAGGTTYQVLRKRSNADLDVEWADPMAAVQVIVASREETQTLAASQTAIDLAEVTTQDCAVYVEGVRLREDEFTRTSDTKLTLAQPYPNGTKVVIVQNEEIGNLDTPPQFDNSKKLATTAFVQRALGSFAGGVTYSSNAALSSADIGKRVVLNAGITVTLPPVSTVPTGSAVLIDSAVGSGSTIQAAAGDGIIAGSGGSVQSVAMSGYDTALFVTGGGNSWIPVLGQLRDKYSGSFGASFAGTGYQNLPSGIIIQWGYIAGGTDNQQITFPIAFPNSCAAICFGDNAGTGEVLAQGYHQRSATGFILRTSSGASDSCSYMAIGY